MSYSCLHHLPPPFSVCCRPAPPYPYSLSLSSLEPLSTIRCPKPKPPPTPPADLVKKTMTTTEAAPGGRASSSVMPFKMGLCQLTVTSDKATNLTRARTMLEEAVHMGAHLLVLPEIWVCPYSHQHFAKCAEKLDDTENPPPPAYCMLSEVARSHGVTIVGGSLPEWRHGRLYNTCCVFGPDGKLKAKHSKLHLFDYYDSQHVASFKESDSLTAGDRPTVVDTDVGCIGIGICHDIRFPELAMLYRAKGADLIIYPGAFNFSTGKMLWELETKARAVDNQLFVAVCSPSRDSAGSYTIWGHSMVVGPSGEVKASTNHQEKIVIAEIDYSENHIQRELFNLQQQRKQKIYQFRDIY